MSTSSSDIGCTKLIKTDIETYPNLPTCNFKTTNTPIQHHERVRKEIDDLEKARIIPK